VTAAEQKDQPDGGPDGERTLSVEEQPDEAGGYGPHEYPAGYRRLQELAVDAVPSAVVVVHNSGAVAVINATARRLFGLSVADIGRPFQGLELSNRPVELRSALERVQKEHVPLVLDRVEWKGGSEGIDCVDIHLVPVAETSGDNLGIAITFVDVSLSRRLQDELERSNRDLETAYEVLQSTIDELETTNDALQSTNGELETLNAELHSTNEVLQTINSELRVRTGELDEVNSFLESMLISQRGGLVVIDRAMRISVWNDQSAELWGVRTDEAPGQHFLNLDIGLPVEELRQPIEAVLSGSVNGERVELHATNRRGREFRCEVSLTPLANRDRQIRGVILLMEEIS
jgi:two-component system CheB/CheR fusion protein